MSSGIRTPLTTLLGVQTPIVAAPMAGASGGILAAQVTLGGGFGFLAAGYDTHTKFEAEIQLARSSLHLETQARLPIGVGFLGWQLEKSNSPALELLSIALRNNVQAVWFAFGSDLGKWVKYIREYDSQNSRDTTKTIVFVQISSTQEALTAWNDWGADVIVAQGIEAGGHGASYSLPLLTLISSVLSVLPSDAAPVIGAGGVSNGGQVASLLTLGASGVVLGTRFLLSPESLYTDAQRQALISASSSLAVRTMAFDHVRGTLGWPCGIDGRALRNSTVDEFDKGEPLELLKEKYAEGVRKSDPDRMLVWAGSGVGLMTKILPADQIVKELHADCVEHLRAVARLL